MEKTSPKASFSLKGTTADHRMDEKRSDNNQKNALKTKYILGSWGKIHEGLVDPIYTVYILDQSDFRSF